jgi:hypothetical protein
MLWIARCSTSLRPWQLLCLLVSTTAGSTVLPKIQGVAVITDASPMHHRCVPCTSTTKPPWNLKRSADLEDPQVFGYLLKGRCSSQSLPAVTWEHRAVNKLPETQRSIVMLCYTWICCSTYGGDVSQAMINHPYFDGLCDPFIYTHL